VHLERIKLAAASTPDVGICERLGEVRTERLGQASRPTTAVGAVSGTCSIQHRRTVTDYGTISALGVGVSCFMLVDLIIPRTGRKKRVNATSVASTDG